MPGVQHDVECAGDGNHELVAGLHRGPGPRLATRNVVQVVNTLDVERDVARALDEAEISAPLRIADLGQLQHARTRGGFHQSGAARAMRAGEPATTHPAGTSLLTSEPAATTAPAPIRSPGRRI